MSGEPEAMSTSILSRYVTFLEQLTEEALKRDAVHLVAPDVFFRDPFNESRGIDGYIRIFQDMYDKTEWVRFKVSVQAAQSHIGFLRWNFECKPRSRWAGNEFAFEGVSALTWNTQGLITEHLDYWDAGRHVYEKLPVVGSLLRCVKKGFAA